MYKILVVDDEANIREVIKEYAEFEGHEVDEAPPHVLKQLVARKGYVFIAHKIKQQIILFRCEIRLFPVNEYVVRNNLGPYRKFIVTLRGLGYKFEA